MQNQAKSDPAHAFCHPQVPQVCMFVWFNSPSLLTSLLEEVWGMLARNKKIKKIEISLFNFFSKNVEEWAVAQIENQISWGKIYDQHIQIMKKIYKISKFYLHSYLYVCKYLCYF